jgi:hypothetical protein
MDIIFQSGEFYSDSSFWSDLIIQVVGAVIGAFVAIYLFFRQLNTNKISEESKKFEYEVDKLKYLATSLDSIIGLIQLQIEGIENFIEEVSKNYIDVPLLSIYSTHDIDRLVNKINHEDYYHAFIRQNRDIENAAKRFKKIYSVLDYFESVLNQMMQYLERERLHDYDRKVQFKKHVEDSEKYYFSALNSSNDDSLKRELNELIIHYMERRDVKADDLTIPKSEFLDPAISIMVQFMKTNTAFHDAATQIKMARTTYFGITQSNMHMIENFTRYGEGLKENLIRIREEMTLLDKYKT